MRNILSQQKEVFALVMASLIATLLAAFTPANTYKKPLQVAQIATHNAEFTRKKLVTVSRRSSHVMGTSSIPAVNDPVPEVAFPTTAEVTITVAHQPQLAKLDSYRNPLGAGAKAWDCVIDHTTGLVWEVKTNNQGLQDAGHFYSWYNADNLLNLGNAGLKDNGKCRGGIDCDTESYIRAINAKKLCGYTDWRLPTRAELMTLVQYDPTFEKKGLIDRKFFPHGSVDWYWSSDTDETDPANAWYVLYYNGRAMKAAKNQAKKIRLVRGNNGQHSFRNVAGQPAANQESLAAGDKNLKLNVVDKSTAPAS